MSFPSKLTKSDVDRINARMRLEEGFSKFHLLEINSVSALGIDPMVTMLALQAWLQPEDMAAWDAAYDAEFQKRHLTQLEKLVSDFFTDQAVFLQAVHNQRVRIQNRLWENIQNRLNGNSNENGVDSAGNAASEQMPTA